MPKQQATLQADARDLEQCYREEYTTLLRLAQVAMNDAHLAEVVVQETFLCALRYIEKFTESPNHMGWLVKALRYNANHVRREQMLLSQRYVALTDLNAPTTDPITLDNLKFRDYSNNEDMQLLFRFYIQGYSAKELAAELGISTAATNMRLMRARERLRRDPYLKGLHDTKL